MSDSADQHELTFALADGERALERVKASLAGFGRLEVRSLKERVRLVDTFDRRLTRAGLELRLWGRGSHVLWELVEPDGGIRATRGPARLAFANDLPPGPLREHVGPVIKPRRLLIVADVVVRGEQIVVLGPDDETLVRASIETLTPADEAPVGPILLLTPLRGREARTKEVVATLERELGHPARPTGRWAWLEPEANGQDATPETKRPPLTPEMPLPRALRLTLLPQLEIFAANLDGARRNLDPEFLHDLRVASRRSRALLGEVRRELADSDAERLREGLRKVGLATNAARDLDVLLLELEVELEGAAAADRAGLETIRRSLLADRQGEARRVKARLGSPATKALVQSWRSWIQSEAAEGTQQQASPDGIPTIHAVAARRLQRRARRMVEDARRADPATRAEDLHELRLLGKKVRYLLEAWGSLVLERPSEVIRELKGVQDRLGELNDLAVQQTRLRQVARHLVRRDVAALLALGAWLERLRAREHERRTELVAHRELWLPAIEEVARVCRRISKVEKPTTADGVSPPEAPRKRRGSAP